MTSLSVLSLISTAAAWHGNGHSLTGWFFEKVRPDRSHKSRIMMENALATFTLDTKDGCYYNTWGNFATFADNIKDSSGVMSDWHWNDIIGHISYYGSDSDNIKISEAKGQFDLIPATERNHQMTQCTDEAEGCYGDRGVPAFRDTGHNWHVLTDVRENLFEAGTGIGSQGANPFSPIIRAFMLRYYVHCAGDAHNPLHSGSMYNNVGQDEHCCPIAYGYDATTQQCAPDVDGNPVKFGPDTVCDGEDWPRSFCKKKSDLDPVNGASGDYGGNGFIVNIVGEDRNYFGTWKYDIEDDKSGYRSNIHSLWDSSFGMFESTRNQVTDEPWLVCNEDENGNLKQIDLDETVLTENGELVTTTRRVQMNEAYGAEFESHPDFVDTIKCHIDHMIEDLPENELQQMMHDQISSILSDYYVDNAPEIPKEFFSPYEIDHMKWQDEMNWMRHWLIYYPFMQTENGLKGVDCWDTGNLNPLPNNWVMHSRKVVRSFVTLAGYRIANGLDDIAKNVVESPLDSLYGSYDEICLLDSSDSLTSGGSASGSLASYAGSAISLFLGMIF